MALPLSISKMRRCPHCDAPFGEALAAACARCFHGTAVCGGYHLAEEIGHGGLGTVYAAESATGQRAAVKVLPLSPLNPAEVHAVFCDSARLLATLAHPSLPRVLGVESTLVGQDARPETGGPEGRRGRSFLALERLDGGTLAQRVMAGERFVASALRDLLHALLSVVQHLHDHDVLHGDVTPRNVMFRLGEQRPVLIDFDGIAAEGDARFPTLVVTPGYTAPEQRAGEVSIEADLYGVGATAYYAATGRSPNSLDRHGGRPDLAHVRGDAVTKAVLAALLHLDPSRRPRSAELALRLLDEAAPPAELAPHTPSVKSVREAPRTSRRPLVVTLVAAALAAVVGITMASQSTHDGTPDAPAPARVH